jgi:hypothetical protein
VKTPLARSQSSTASIHSRQPRLQRPISIVFCITGCTTVVDRQVRADASIEQLTIDVDSLRTENDRSSGATLTAARRDQLFNAVEARLLTLADSITVQLARLKNTYKAIQQ